MIRSSHPFIPTLLKQSEFMGAKKSLLKYQSEMDRLEREKLEESLNQSNEALARLQMTLNIEKKTAEKREALLDSAMTGFVKNVFCLPWTLRMNC